MHTNQFLALRRRDLRLANGMAGENISRPTSPRYAGVVVGRALISTALWEEITFANFRDSKGIARPENQCSSRLQNEASSTELSKLLIQVQQGP
jgi:hypothetical protein